MNLFIWKYKTRLVYKVLCSFITFTFISSMLISPQVMAQSMVSLPMPGAMVSVTPAYTPALIKGITIHPENPLMFDFIIDGGDSSLAGKALKEETDRFVKYFLTSLTVPEDELWVNLSPYEKNRIIPQSFGETEMGRDLLAQDYLLKQLTASLMYPEKELGQKFWNRVYKKAYELYGMTEIPMNTFNKVWIVPSDAVVLEKGNTAYVVDSHLKVMMEEDYVAMEHNSVGTGLAPIRYDLSNLREGDSESVSKLTSNVIREVLIPEIEKEVNEGKTFANLRQIYNPMILAMWYKANLKESLLGKVYVNQNKIKGVEVEDKQVKQKIYDQYVKAFQKGVYNYIREDVDQVTQEIIPRKYFSGGFGFDPKVYKPVVIDGDKGFYTAQEQALLEAGFKKKPLSDAIHKAVVDLVENANKEDQGKGIQVSSPIKASQVEDFGRLVNPQEVLKEDWKYYSKEITKYLRLIKKGDVEAKENLMEFLDMVGQYVEKTMQLAPVEAHWPILKAVALLNKKDRLDLLKILEEKTETGERRVDQFESNMGDSIRLMFNLIDRDWLGKNAQELKGRVIYTLSAENTLIAGGLGYVQQVHERFMRELGAQVISVETIYQNVKKTDGSGLMPMGVKGYVEHYGLKADSLKVLGVREVDLAGEKTRVRIWQAEKSNGQIGIFIEELAEGESEEIPEGIIPEGGKAVKYTNVIYDYNNYGNRSDAEYGAFYAKTAKAAVEMKEINRKKEEGKQWKSAVIWGQDSQSSASMALFVEAMEEASEGSVFKDIFPTFTTHTFGNRQYFGLNQQQWILGDLLGLNSKWWNASVREGQMDMASLAIRMVDYAMGKAYTVSRKHDLVLKRNKIDYPEVVTEAASNGDELSRTRNWIKKIYKGIYNKELDDVGDLTWQQVREIKQEAGEEFKESFKNLTENAKEQLEGFDSTKPTVGYAGRLVQVKVSPYRMFTLKNIRKLIENGKNVVLLTRVQGYHESEDLSRMYRELADQIAQEKKDNPSNTENWGSFIFTEWYEDNQKQLMMIASEIIALDSDDETGTNEWTEVNGAAALAWILASPWEFKINQHKSILGEGTIAESNELGVNLIIPSLDKALVRRAIEIAQKKQRNYDEPLTDEEWRTLDDVSYAYFKVVNDKLNEIENEDTVQAFYEGSKKSGQMAQIANGTNTGAAYLRTDSNGIALRKNVKRDSQKLAKDFIAMIRRDLSYRQQLKLVNKLLFTGRNGVDQFKFTEAKVYGNEFHQQKIYKKNPWLKRLAAKEKGDNGLVTFLISKLIIEEVAFDGAGALEYMKRGDYRNYVSNLLKGLPGSYDLIEKMGELEERSDIGWYKKDRIFTTMMISLVKELGDLQNDLSLERKRKAPTQFKKASSSIQSNPYSYRFDENINLPTLEQKQELLSYFESAFQLLGIDKKLQEVVQFTEENIKTIAENKEGIIYINSRIYSLLPSKESSDQEKEQFQIFITDLMRQQYIGSLSNFQNARQNSYQYFAVRERDLKLLLEFIDKNDIQMNTDYQEALEKIQFHQFSEFDKHLFNDQGRHYEVYQKLGAHIIKEGNNVVGTYFAVWAPNAQEANVEIYGIDGKTESYQMNKWESAGIWQVYVPHSQIGTRYKYVFLGANGEYIQKRDPYAFQSEYPDAEHQGRKASIIADMDAFVWDDDHWVNSRQQHQNLNQPFSVYEMHIGTWRRSQERKNNKEEGFLTYRELAKELGDYLVEMGYTHVEFLPPTEHSLEGMGSYLPTNLFAPSSRYGSPNDFKYLVDYLHSKGIGVVMDWVPAHFPKDSDGLIKFDGTEIYSHLDSRKGEHKDWGSQIPNFGRNEVMSFYISNALFWLSQYHIDGLRVDAVASMLYLDYSREDGEWEPHPSDGSNINWEAVEFIKRFNDAVKEYSPGVLTIAEESTAWPGVTQATSEEKGLGFDLKWGMGWMNDTLEFFAKDPIYRKYHHDEITQFFNYVFSERFQLALSHDEVVHGKKSLLDKMPGDVWQKFANLRLLYGLMYMVPGSKLLFMGGEFGQWLEWNEGQSLDWHLLEKENNPNASLHRGIQKFIRDLNEQYKKEDALHEKSYVSEGFQPIDFSDVEKGIISFIRRNNAGEEIVSIFNFTPNVYKDYRIGLPDDGVWKMILNSDGEFYGGSGVGQVKEVQADNISLHGQPNSFEFTIPPLGMVSFKRISEDSLGIDLSNYKVKEQVRALRRSLIRYTSSTKEQRMDKNNAFKWLEKVVLSNNFEGFSQRFSLLANIVESADNKEILSTADLTLMIHEMAEKSSELKVNLKTMLDALIDQTDDSTVKDVAQKVKRWMDIGSVAFISPEAVPFFKAGGMANVVGELSIKLAELGLKVYVFLPRYPELEPSEIIYTGKIIDVPLGENGFAKASIAQKRQNGVEYKFLDNPHLADGLYLEGKSNIHNIAKATFLSLGALEAMKVLNINPSLIVGNDWMTASAMAHLNSDGSLYKQDSYFSKVKTIGWIHNNGQDYQFKVPRFQEGQDLLSYLGLPEEDYGWFIDPHQPDLINMMHAFIRHSQFSVAVSPGQLEDYVTTDAKGGGEGFMHVFQEKINQKQLGASVNGIPLVELQNERFGMSLRDVKNEEDKANFLKVQKDEKMKSRQVFATRYPEFWRTEDGKTDQLSKDNFVVTLVARMDGQKGIKFVPSFVRRVLNNQKYSDVTFIFSGKGNSDLMKSIYELSEEFPGRVGYNNDALNNKEKVYEHFYGEGDLFLSLSEYEPGGIAPMEALAYGVPVLASDRQGHKSTVRQFGEEKPNGARFEIVDGNVEETVGNIMEKFEGLYDLWSKREEAEDWTNLVFNALTSDNSWEKVSKVVEAMFKYSLGETEYYPIIVKASNLDEITQSLNSSSSIIADNQSQMTNKEVGGINLNPALLNLQIRRDEEGVPLPVFDQPIETMQIEGFLPVIIQLVPMTNLSVLLGLVDTEKKETQDSEDLKLSILMPVDRKGYFLKKEIG